MHVPHVENFAGGEHMMAGAAGAHEQAHFLRTRTAGSRVLTSPLATRCGPAVAGLAQARVRVRRQRGQRERLRRRLHRKRCRVAYGGRCGVASCAEHAYVLQDSVAHEVRELVKGQLRVRVLVHLPNHLLHIAELCGPTAGGRQNDSTLSAGRMAAWPAAAARLACSRQRGVLMRARARVDLQIRAHAPVHPQRRVQLRSADEA